MEDFILSTQILTEFDFVAPKNYKVRAIVFLLESKKVVNLFERELLGNKMKNWVIDALNPIETTCIPLFEKEDCFEKAKQNIKDEDFTICLFSDTPLIKNSTIMELLDYAQTKDLDFCKLPRGFIVKSQNFKANNIILSADANFVDKQDFYCVFDETTLCCAKEILRKRILERHLKNGVTIEDLNTITIDYNVQIGKNVTIKQNNILRNKTIVEDDVILEPFNIVDNSVIGKKSVIVNSYVLNSKTAESAKIGPFEKLINNKEKSKWN